MSQRCPRCGLFSPATAGRCDCGYDFASRTIQGSYLMAHVVRKHGSESKIADQAAHAKMRTGAILLIIAGLVAAGSFLANGQVAFLGGAVMVGALSLVRGWQQRKRRALDRETLNDLMRRS